MDRSILKFGLMFEFLLCVSGVKAQDTYVDKVRFQDKVETITVQYNLRGKEGKKYQIDLSLSDDGGKTFTIQPKTLSGDVGKNVEPGVGKEIVWNLKKDIPGGLRGNRFVFAVDAELQKGSKALLYTIGGMIGAGTIYYYTRKKADGSIGITVPAQFP